MPKAGHKRVITHWMPENVRLELFETLTSWGFRWTRDDGSLILARDGYLHPVRSEIEAYVQLMRTMRRRVVPCETKSGMGYKVHLRVYRSDVTLCRDKVASWHVSKPDGPMCKMCLRAFQTIKDMAARRKVHHNVREKNDADDDLLLD